MEIPPFLEAQIREGKAVLVLGSGASLGAKTRDGRTPPLGQDLARMLADKFLGGGHRAEPLANVAEYAISESSPVEVYRYIRSVFEPLEPAAFHRLIARFRWHGLASTNYDLVVEKAYAAEGARLQSVQPIVEDGDGIEDFLRDPANVLFLKLHGCVTRPNCPLILTTEQYITYLRGRGRLFSILESWAFERPLIFAGHSMQDSDLRALLLRMSDIGERRSRYFLVAPDVDATVQKFWDSKRISTIAGTFEEFLGQLDSTIPAPFRALAVVRQETPHPIVERFVTRSVSLSEPCLSFLTTDAEYVKGIVSTATTDPKGFYRGENPGWSAIEQNLDVRRTQLDTVLVDFVLRDTPAATGRPDVFLVKGHAGAGKSVLLKRLAWEASRLYDRTCIFLRRTGSIDTSAVRELLQACSGRLYLFVDDAADHAAELLHLLKGIGPEGQNLTLILGERVNEWNACSATLGSYVNDDCLVEYLDPAEIDGLLSLLDRHKALDNLEKLSPEERRDAFAQRAGRQLLVALHEATRGLPFEVIIEDEYDHIVPLEAKELYLTVCVLNRLNVPVRAGVISRVHDIPFDYFRKHFFEPLEHVVHTEYHNGLRDYVYFARHPSIAEMVFRRALVNVEDRLDKYVRALRGLNLAFGTDERAFRQMVRGRVLHEVFPTRPSVERVFRAALDVAGDDAFLIQQMALYEMNAEDGDLEKATTLLTKAARLAPGDLTIRHSQAELQLRLSDVARTTLEKHERLAMSARIARDLRGERSRDGGYAYHTLVKISLRKLALLLDDEDDDRGHETAVAQAIREAEEWLDEGLQRYPGEAHLLEAESRLAKMLKDSARALRAMHGAFAANPGNSYIASRLARLLEASGDSGGAQRTLEKALEENPTDLRLHYAYAKHLMRHRPQDGTEIAYHLQRSFVADDSNFEAQLLYGRQLFMNGDHEGARRVFGALKDARVPLEIRSRPSYPLETVQYGRIRKVESTYCFIELDGFGDWVFAHRSAFGRSGYPLRPGPRVAFRLAFCFRGLVAQEVTTETQPSGADSR